MYLTQRFVFTTRHTLSPLLNISLSTAACRRLRTRIQSLAGSSDCTRAASHMHSADVPESYSAVQKIFFGHPSAYLPSIAILALVLLRLQQPLSVLDLPVAIGVVVFWLIQEWMVHNWLLHSSFAWIGKRIHMEHHRTPYFHISLDPPELLLSVMAIAATVFWVVFSGGPLAFTATAAYYAAGLTYEWLHYVVHTRWVPPANWWGSWLRSVRRHHMLHHMRNENYWLSFSAPMVDALFGTLPSTGSSVPLTDMARAAHGAQTSSSRDAGKDEPALAAVRSRRPAVPATVAGGAVR